MAAFDQGVFNYSAYGTTEYVLLGLVGAFVLAIVVMSIVIALQVKKYKKQRNRNLGLQLQREMEIKPSFPLLPQQPPIQKTESEPVYNNTAAKQYGRIAWPDQVQMRKAPKPLPAIPTRPDQRPLPPTPDQRPLPPTPVYQPNASQHYQPMLMRR